MLCKYYFFTNASTYIMRIQCGAYTISLHLFYINYELQSGANTISLQMLPYELEYYNVVQMLLYIAYSMILQRGTNTIIICLNAKRFQRAVIQLELSQS